MEVHIHESLAHVFMTYFTVVSPCEMAAIVKVKTLTQTSGSGEKLTYLYTIQHVS